MATKNTKTEQIKLNFKPQGTKKQYFNVNKKQLKCFIGKQQPYSPAQLNKTNSNQIQQKKESQQQINVNLIQNKKYLADSPDLARKVVNDIINRIQDQGLQLPVSDTVSFESNTNRSSSSLQNSFSSNNIWKNDWTSHSLSKSIYTEGNYSCHSLQKYHSKQYPSTHRSSNISFQNYQHSSFRSNTHHSYYYTPQSWNNFEIVFDTIEADGRTTVMIKNIPNKYSLSGLADQIDLTHQGQYDFLYLPFDCTSKCNMGYAFINILSSQSLKTFYETYNRRKWLKFKSEKICQLSYARLQGRTSLIDHFHSSKVFNQKGKNYKPMFKDLSQQKDFSEIKSIIAKQKQNPFLSTIQTNF